MVQTAFSGTASLQSALENGKRLLATDPAGAERQAMEILRRDPHNSVALRLRAASLRRQGRTGEAEQAEIEAIKASAHNPVLVECARAIKEGRWREAEERLRPHLDATPDDAAALNMLAQIAAHAGAHDRAVELLEEALGLAPAFAAARLKLGDVLVGLNRPQDAVPHFEDVLHRQPGHIRASAALASALARLGEYPRAIGLYGELLKEQAANPDLWMSYGHILKTTGELPEAIKAYREAIAADPTFGEAWWSLANLKTVRFDDQDTGSLRAALSSEGLDDKRRLHLHFALAKALDDDDRFEEAFRHYAEGNRIRRAMLDYNPGMISTQVNEAIQLFTPEFFTQRIGQSAEAPDPIFILGMPRAGSTLVEQILSSHSMVEGTSELPYIPTLAREFLANDPRFAGLSYPSMLAQLEPTEIRSLGDEYLRRASAHRKTDKPFFIDKLPNNWLDVGFIRLILPNAKIIDARRHPLDCCFSNFKQHFAHGQGFTYDLADLGHYYRDYVRLMQHFDAVQPGRIHRVIHEKLVEDQEAQIGRLLDFLGLPFEEGCLRFYENQRAVRTPSAEQVRRPINRDGMGQWKPYERWLQPLVEALGPVLVAYADVPSSKRQ